MPALTNDLLAELRSAISALNDAVSSAQNLGIPISPDVPFYRMGDPIRVQATPTSGGDRFDLTGSIKLPPNVTSFMAWNNNPFPIRLKGTFQGQAFQPVTGTTGLCFYPGGNGPFTTRYPIAYAVQSIDGPFAGSDPAQKAGTGYIEMQYGTGA